MQYYKINFALNYIKLKILKRLYWINLCGITPLYYKLQQRVAGLASIHKRVYKHECMCVCVCKMWK